jgi:hypothetical protein
MYIVGTILKENEVFLFHRKRMENHYIQIQIILLETAHTCMIGVIQVHRSRRY